jgi:DNA-binding Lrp family transcriptional regulator
MDEVDRSILAVLEVDGRISNAELAARSACRRRPACGVCADWRRPG